MDHPHPYLSGPHAPVDEEHLALDLTVRGTLPVGLDGTYVRTGPNPVAAPDPTRYHWLTGAGMVHGVHLAQGAVSWYRNRWIASPEVTALRGGAPAPMPDAMVPPGTGNTSLAHHAGRLLAFSEMALPYSLSPTLETLGGCDFGGPMPAGACAHARHDARTGELHTLAYHLEPPYLRHHVVDERGALRTQRALPVDRPVMVHDFALTAEHLVVFDLPVLFDEEAMMDGEPLPYRWRPETGARVGLVPRAGDGTDARWFDLDPCWIPHVIGARVDGPRLHLDLIRRPSLFAEDLRGDDDGAPVHMHLTLDPARDGARGIIGDASVQDFPVTDPRRAPGTATRAWTLGLVERGGHALPCGDRVFTHDLLAGTTRVDRLPRRMLASELTFVPAHPRAAEDEGWLVGFVHDEDGGASRFVVFDARRPRDGTLAEVDLPVRVPLGLHGCWIAEPGGRG